MPLHAYALDDGQLRPLEGGGPKGIARASWIDICQPSEEERAEMEKALGIKIPAAPHPGSRIGRALRLSVARPWMPAALIGRRHEDQPALRPVVFALLPGRLISVSYDGPDDLKSYVACDEASRPRTETPIQILAMLLDCASDLCGDALDLVSVDLEAINQLTFREGATSKQRARLGTSPRLRNRQLERVLQKLGATDDALVKISRCVLTVRRLVGALKERLESREAADELDRLERKLKILDEAENDLSATAAFMLQGAVGAIGIQQSKTMNTLTVIGVLLTPPVVVASIYGMNFDVMPELQWKFGYLLALGLMGLSAVGMYLIARYKGWL